MKRSAVRAGIEIFEVQLAADQPTCTSEEEERDGPKRAPHHRDRDRDRGRKVTNPHLGHGGGHGGGHGSEKDILWSARLL